MRLNTPAWRPEERPSALARGRSSKKPPALTFFLEVHPDSEMTRQNHKLGSNRDASWRFMTNRARGGARPCDPKHSLGLLQAFGSLLMGLWGLAGSRGPAARARLARVARSRLRAAGPSRSGTVARNGSVSDLSVGDWLAAADCTSINYCRSVGMTQSDPWVAADPVG